MKNILVVGSVNMDLTIYTNRIPNVGETIIGNSFCTSPGGKGANQAIAAARLGANVRFLGAVGNDTYGTELLENLKVNNVDFQGEVLDDTSTGIAVITVCNANNSIIIDKGANGKISAQYVDKYKELFEWADFVVMQAEIAEDAIIESAKLAKLNSATVVFNPAPYSEFSDELYNYVDFIIPNETETELLTGICIDSEKNINTAMKKLYEKGIKETIITLGERGCAYSSGTEVRYIQANKVKAVDTTAAGDCFIGAFVKELAEEKSKSDAIEYANKAAALAVSRYGASNSLPMKEELE